MKTGTLCMLVEIGLIDAISPAGDYNFNKVQLH